MSDGTKNPEWPVAVTFAAVAVAAAVLYVVLTSVGSGGGRWVPGGLYARRELVRWETLRRLGPSCRDSYAIRRRVAELAFRDPSALVRGEAVEAAARIWGAKVAGLFEEALSDPDPYVRMSALVGISRGGGGLRWAEKILKKAATDSEPDVAAFAGTLLKRCGEPAGRSR